MMDKLQNRVGRGASHLQRIALAGALLGLPVMASASLVYTVDRQVGAASVSGTIETDGAHGRLGAANLLGWSLAVTDGAGSVLQFQSGATSEVYVLGDGLTATASGLYFDFSAVAAVLQFQNPGIGRGGNWWCLESRDSFCLGVHGGESVGPANAYGELAVRQGQVQIGRLGVSAVPEPASLALVLTGLGLATCGRRSPRPAA